MQQAANSLVAHPGIPAVIGFLADQICAGLPPKKQHECRELFRSSLSVGADLTSVWPKFADWLLRDRKRGIARFASSKSVRAVIEEVGQMLRAGCSDADAWQDMAARAEAVARASRTLAASPDVRDTAAYEAADVAAYVSRSMTHPAFAASAVRAAANAEALVAASVAVDKAIAAAFLKHGRSANPQASRATIAVRSEKAAMKAGAHTGQAVLRDARAGSYARQSAKLIALLAASA